MKNTTKTISATEACGNFGAILDEVTSSHEEVLVTKDGQPVAKIIPIAPAREKRSRESLRGSVKVLGDIVAPLGEEWDAAR